MDIYIFVVIFTFIFCSQIKVQNGDRKAYLKKIIWCFLPIFIYGALRENFGIDYRAYKSTFEYLNGKPQLVDPDAHEEIGYQWLNVIMPSWRLLVMLVSTSVVVAFGFLYYKYVEPKMLMLALFFTMFYPSQSFFLSFVAMRNGLAIAGTFLCVPLIVKRKYGLLLPIIVGLSLLHTSALLFLPLAIVIGQNFDLSKKEIYIWVMAVFSLSILSTTDIFNLVMPIMSGDVFSSYKSYYMKEDDHNSLLNCSANAAIMYWIVAWAYRNRRRLTPSQNTIWRLSMLYLICPFLGVLGRTRMNFFYLPFYIITITYLMKDKWPSKNQKTAFIGLTVAVTLYSLWILVNGKHYAYSHYESIFSNL